MDPSTAIGFSAAQISRSEIEQGRKNRQLQGGSWWESERKASEGPPSFDSFIAWLSSHFL